MLKMEKNFSKELSKNKNEKKKLNTVPAKLEPIRNS